MMLNFPEIPGNDEFLENARKIGNLSKTSRRGDSPVDTYPAMKMHQRLASFLFPTVTLSQQTWANMKQYSFVYFEMRKSMTPCFKQSVEN